MPPRFAAPSADAIPLWLLAEADLDTWLASQPTQVRNWVAANGFTGAMGQNLVLPDASGQPDCALAGFGTPQSRKTQRFALAGAVQSLPSGVYALQEVDPSVDLERETLGCLLASYRFDRYREQLPMKAALVAPPGIDAARVEALAAAEFLTRDLINTPASDMGPASLEAAAFALAEQFGAQATSIVGDALLSQNYPMIHTVGRAAAQEPRLIDLRWGDTGPDLVLVGKGVTFDTGGLNLKPGRSMGLMKKDMGGAASVLGLAQMIMALDLPLRLRVLIPAVENAVSSNAFRPQDILTSRKGLTVEVNNTDAEGRLVLADALALADEGKPDLIVSMATLTGAARVALGPDVPPFFTDDARSAAALEAVTERAADPIWRLPLHAPYETMIEPGIADLDNAPSGGFAGAITAALFLRRFVTDAPRYVHFDLYGWQPSAAPGLPKGGVLQGARSMLAALPEILDL